MKKLAKTIIVHALTFALMLAACGATVFGVTPFGFSVHLAALLSGGSPLASLYFAAASALSGLSLPALATGSALAALGAVTNTAVKMIPAFGRKRLWRWALNLALQSALYGLLGWVFGYTRLETLIAVLLGAAFGALASFAAPMLAGGDFVQPSAPGYAGLAALCVMLFAGLEHIHIGIFSVARFVFALFVLFMCKCRGSGGALTGGMLAGLGGAWSADEPAVFVLCALSALAASAFASGVRALPAAALIIGWSGAACLFTLLMDELPWHLIALGSACAAFLALPRRVITGVRGFFRPGERLTMEAAAAGMGRKLPERLLRASEALGEMSRLLAEDAGLTDSPAVAAALTASLKEVCAGCARHGECALEADMSALAADCIAGGGRLKNNVLAMPCLSGGRMLKRANEARETLMRTVSEGDREGKSAKSYALRLDSLRRLMGKLARGVAEDYRYDPAVSEKLRRDLPECGVPCAGGLVTGELCGVALVPSGTDAAVLEKALRRALGRVRVDRMDDVSSGWTAAAFSPAPALDIVYAVAQTPRQGNAVTGDSYSAEVFGGRALLSLCDGSGTGKGAARLSQATLSLIESHYRAGFDAADGVASVNSFLSSRTGEEFSALDVVSVDLRTGEADILKAGSPSSFLVRGDSMTRIDGSALPVGALETASYALATKRLAAGDVVVLITDGISDALPNLPEVIASQSQVNVRRMADGVLAAAARSGVRDDMSVLVARIIERS